MSAKILLLDTGIGNIQSVANVLEYVGADFWISNEPGDLAKADKVIFPGVGTYGNAMERMKKKGFFEPLVRALKVEKKLCLGICVGMQVMSEMGFEFGEHKGLGVVEGVVEKLDVSANPKLLRLPHVGWNDVKFKTGSALFKGIPDGSCFYFLHSYHFKPKDSRVVTSQVEYGAPVTASIENGNVFGVQFHPEKSQEPGIQLFKNFMGMPC